MFVPSPKGGYDEAWLYVDGKPVIGWAGEPCSIGEWIGFLKTQPAARHDTQIALANVGEQITTSK
jgi:hypothetical protein